MLTNSGTSSPIPDVDISVQKAWCNNLTKWNSIDYKWTINNFSLRPEKTGKFLESPAFPNGISECVKWKLKIYPKGLNEESEEFLSIFISLVCCNKLELKAKFEISVLTNTVSSEHKFKTGPLGYGFNKFINRDTLLDASNNFLPNDILIISCNLSFLSDISNISGPSDVVQITVPQSKLIQDFKNIFDNDELSDVTFVVDNREIRAHKTILAARSSYFMAMFKHETQETLLNRIVVTDVEHDVLKKMLNFIYTDKAPNLDKMAAKLLHAADKYGLERLKAMCEESLRAIMTHEDAIETLTLADRYNAVQLKSYATEFIKSHISEIVATDSWKNVITTQIQQMFPSIEPVILDK